MSANLFVALPFLSSNGDGAAVDVSAMGASKTIVVGGTFDATVTIEYSTAPSGNLWAPVPNGSFPSNPGRVIVDIAAQRMRVVTSDYTSGSAGVSVGGPSVPAEFVHLTGAPADVSALPAFKTVVVDGACNVEISEDGTSYSQIFSFENAGGQSAAFSAEFAKVTNGATCWLGASEVGSPSSIPTEAAGQFVPNGIVDVTVVSQTGQFVNPGVFAGVGLYDIHMVPIPGVTSANQVIPQLTAMSGGPAFGAATVAFSVDHAVITVSMFDTTASPVSDPFYMHVDIIPPT